MFKLGFLCRTEARHVGFMNVWKEELDLLGKTTEEIPFPLKKESQTDRSARVPG